MAKLLTPDKTRGRRNHLENLQSLSSRCIGAFVFRESGVSRFSTPSPGDLMGGQTVYYALPEEGSLAPNAALTHIDEQAGQFPITCSLLRKLMT